MANDKPDERDAALRELVDALGDVDDEPRPACDCIGCLRVRAAIARAMAALGDRP